ncbi:LysR substrate-binding domain-containing protein [Acinetobacter sp. MD2]|uniref:LysR substrate-binding domain-containing protein n=1 Tax=Acinetobacter sp. MD2 TaxID=2600066 RepID=UPI002D1EF132|nr:LysR substrate-binding domain-containing protein [Acinetobacter sp. MD2]MEB3767403.1 LysR family transcriptional regulator [Acinetobacter sp. MD2]
MKSSIEELQRFIAIVDTGSIVAAAELLGQTSSGVSRSLSRLEQKLHVTLIERTTRKIKLSQEGEVFLTKARQILHDLAEAEDAVLKADQDLTGTIRIDSATPFILHVIAPLVQTFQQQYPLIEIELNSNDQIIDLLEQKTDVAFRFGELNDSTLHAKLVCKSRLYIVASPEYLVKYGHPTQVVDLAQHHLIGFSRVLHLNHWPLKISEAHFIAKAKVKASNGETVRHLALRGQGIACLSEFMVWQDIAEGRLVALFEDQIERREQHIHAVYYQQAHLPKRVRLFIDFIAERLKDGFAACC